LDILDKGFLKMSHICLLVLDECHHATESHNMKLVRLTKMVNTINL